MRNRNIILSIILIFGIIVMAVVTFILIKFPNNNNSLDINDNDRVVIVDETPSYREERLTYDISHYSDRDGKVDIEYPQVDGYLDDNSTKNVNTKLQVNATSILALHELKDNIDSLDINCTVKSFDNDKIVVVYEGELLYHTGKVKVENKNTNNNYDTYDEKPANSSSSRKSNNVNSNFGYDPNYDNYGGVQSGNTSNTYNGFGDPNYDNYIGSNTNSSNTNSPISQNSSSGNPTFFGGNTGLPISNTDVNANMYPGANNAITGFANTKFYEKKIYYTNTVDLKTCKDIYLSECIDINVLSELIKGNDKNSLTVISENENEVRKYMTKLSLTNIKKMLKEADFQNSALTFWPESFSYVDNDYVYVSLPTNSELNDYVIIRYKK